jgi:hypothetical protein
VRLAFAAVIPFELDQGVPSVLQREEAVVREPANAGDTGLAEARALPSPASVSGAHTVLATFARRTLRLRREEDQGSA